MKSSVTEKAEKIKTIIGDTALKSKEAVQEIISMNTRYLDQALDSNKVIVEGIRQQFQFSEQGTPIFDTLNKAFGKSVELSEETIDSIIEGYNKQIQLYVDYNTRLIDTIKESATYSSNNGEIEKILKVIHDSFESSVNAMNASMKTIIESYNKHTNLALNFNKKFGDNVTAQLGVFSELQTGSMNIFSSWASEWWKHNDHK
jgi:hypothetical protein